MYKTVVSGKQGTAVGAPDPGRTRPGGRQDCHDPVVTLMCRMATTSIGRRALGITALLVAGACSTGPSTACRLTLAGAVDESVDCAGVVFTSTNGQFESTYADTVRGSAPVELLLEYPSAPDTIGPFGADDGENALVSVHDSTASWTVGIGLGPSAPGGSFTLKISNVTQTGRSGDSTRFTVHGTLDATLKPDSGTTAADSVILRMSF